MHVCLLYTCRIIYQRPSLHGNGFDVLLRLADMRALLLRRIDTLLRLYEKRRRYPLRLYDAILRLYDRRRYPLRRRYPQVASCAANSPGAFVSSMGDFVSSIGFMLLLRSVPSSSAGAPPRAGTCTAWTVQVCQATTAHTDAQYNSKGFIMGAVSMDKYFCMCQLLQLELEPKWPRLYEYINIYPTRPLGDR